MNDNLNLKILNATYKIEQGQETGNIVSGTVWIVRLSQAGEFARYALVTASHVLDMMKKQNAIISWRKIDDNQKWVKEPSEFRIRDDNNHPLWLTHPERDIAVIWIDPPNFAKQNAIEFDLLADEKTIKKYNLNLGDEIITLGFPRGLPANGLGFAILRSGRVASYPVWPVRDFPSFLVDLTIFPGNSGGPAYVVEKVNKNGKFGNEEHASFVVGLIAKQVNLNDESLEIGLVIHSSFIRDILLELLSDYHDDAIV